MNYEPITHNQKGISSLVLLLIIVFGVFILWEMNEFVGNYTTAPLPSFPPAANNEPICKTGQVDDCNDSNDQFIFVE